MSVLELHKKWPRVYQVAKYGIVGVIATVIHNGIYHILMESHFMNSTFNNLLCYFFSLQVSYWGHRLVTFSNPKNLSTKQSLRKFMISAGAAILLSSLVSYIFIDTLQYSHYWLIMFNVCCLPFFTFLLLKLWVFKTV